ncbi:MAG: hypothetical protein J1F23_04145 [Oscillospiraceae bacterium]|nr:hypothetical protein [Oscillospiraceae bacterium]
MIKAKKLIIPSVIIFVCLALGLLIFEIRDRNLKTELIDEIKIEDFQNSLYTDYFFIRSDEYINFYDGFEMLEEIIPDYDFEKLDTEQFTYLVSVNGTVNTIEYSGRNCKMRNAIGLPVTYTAFLDYEKTNDNIIRIYKIKKIDIDYDYHSI